MQTDKKRMLQISDQHIALGHDMFYFVPFYDGLLIEHFDCVDFILEFVIGHVDFAEATLSNHL